MRRFVFLFYICVSLLTTSCLNEDGNLISDPTYESILNNANVPEWRSRCNIERRSLVDVVVRVPKDGEILGILSCDTILIKLRGQCYLITNGFRSHCWSSTNCPK